MNVHVQPLGQPTPGSAKPGNLYADLQSRSLWLGVDLAVHSSGSVLISDMVALMAEIDATEVACKLYTDQQVALKAPLNHGHTSEQISDFDEAVTEVATSIPSLNYVRGMIMLWSGLIADIGIGDLSQWALCDGTQYQVPKPPPLTGFDTVTTPDLRNRFIIGASTNGLPPGTKNLLTNTLTTDSKGSHNHTVNGHVLLASQIPAHTHGPGTLAGTTSGNTGIESASHTHNVTRYSSLQSVDWGSDAGSPAAFWYSTASVASGGDNQNHTHSMSGGACDVSTGVTAANVGGGGSHTHTITDNNGAHSHVMTMGAVREAIPYYALAFIMKL